MTQEIPEQWRWGALPELEHSARASLASKLAPFETSVQLCYELTLAAPTLAKENILEENLNAVVRFLRDAATDLRSIWKLLSIGYTSQAATVATSLYKNALVAGALVGSQRRTDELNAADDGGIPWSAVELAQIHAKQQREEAAIAGREFSEHDYEVTWKQVYVGYKILCRATSPPVQSAPYDSTSTLNDEKDPAPGPSSDLRAGDLSVKAIILLVSLSRLYQAIHRYALHAPLDRAEETYSKYISKISELPDAIKLAYDAIAIDPLPFSLAHDKDLINASVPSSRGTSTSSTPGSRSDSEDVLVCIQVLRNALARHIRLVDGLVAATTDDPSARAERINDKSVEPEMQILGLMLAALGSSSNTLVSLSNDPGLQTRDCYSIVRSIVELAINICYIIGEGPSAAQQGVRHAQQKSFRDLERDSVVGTSRIRLVFTGELDTSGL